MSIGQRIRRRREEQGLSFTDLARLSGVSKGYLSETENNSSARSSAATLFTIASALGASAGELLGKGGPDTHPCQPSDTRVPSAIRRGGKASRSGGSDASRDSVPR